MRGRSRIIASGIVTLVMLGCAQPPATSDAATSDAATSDAASTIDAGGTDASSDTALDAGPGWQSLCDQLATILDERATECGCSVTHVGCFDDPSDEAVVSAGIAAGTIHYDASALQAVVMGADAATGCGHLYELLGWTFEDYRTFGGAFTGTLGNLAECPAAASGRFPNPCAHGTCSVNPGGMRANVCRDIVEVGMPCELLRLCVDPDAQVHPQEMAGTVCGVGGTCTTAAPGAGADGSTCTQGSDCASGACIGGRGGGTCGAPATDGTPCDFPDDCASSACIVTGGVAACGPGICAL